MKKVECPSCGGTGVIRHGRWSWDTLAYHECKRCEGYGFILIDTDVFPDFKPIKVSRTPCMNGRYFSMDEYREFTGLAKVRNINFVLVDGSTAVLYSTFYKEHRE